MCFHFFKCHISISAPVNTEFRIWAIGKAKNSGALSWIKVSLLQVQLSTCPWGCHRTRQHCPQHPTPGRTSPQPSIMGLERAPSLVFHENKSPTCILSGSWALCSPQCYKQGLPSVVVNACVHAVCFNKPNLLPSGHDTMWPSGSLSFVPQNCWNSTEVAMAIIFLLIFIFFLS